MSGLKQGDKVQLASAEKLKEVFAAKGTFEEGNRNEKADQLAGKEGVLESVSGDDIYFRAEDERVVCIPAEAIAEKVA